MPPFDPNAYNTMQAQAGLPPPQVIFPGQVSAAISAQGGIGAFGSLFPTQTYQTAVGAPPIFQGPTGLMAQMSPGSPYNPYAPANPFAGLSSYGNLAGRPSPFAAYAPQPPPAYAGLPGLGANPFAPLPTASPFDTPYASGIANAHAAHMRDWSAGQAAMGMAAHAGGNFAGAVAGALLGSTLGPVGALAGGVAGFLGAERFGVGRAMQNAYGNAFAAPRLAVMGAAQGLEHLSQGFVASGPNLHASGVGFGFHAALDGAQGLADMSNSADFRRDTRGRFNQQDVFRMTQMSGESGLLAGAGTPQGVVSRMRDIAKSLSAFMELAKEPDIQRAIQTMGQLRSSGLNLQETMGAVAAGRSFARMAGTSFQGLAELGGTIGAQTFQSMGMSMGLGHQVGMGAYGTAASSINQGILGPQLASLVGGAGGLATLNSMYSGGQLQLPMTVPGMMSGRGGFDRAAIAELLGGRSNLFGQTGRGAGVLAGMAGSMGVEGLGMAIGMQPLLQDTLGRIVQGRGLFAGRNLEDTSIMNHMRQMGLSGASGFMTAAQMLGMQGTTAVTRAAELGSGAYWDTQRSQLTVTQREARADAAREREAREPRFFRGLRQGSGFGDLMEWGSRAAYDIGDAWHHFRHGDQAVYGEPGTDAGRRRDRAYIESGTLRRDLRGMDPTEEAGPTGFFGRWRESRALARGRGEGALGSFFSYQDSWSRERDVRSAREASDYAARMASTSVEDGRASMGRLGSTFGGLGGLLDYTQALSQRANSLYDGTSVAITRGSFGLLGNVPTLGRGHLQTAFRETLRRQGLSNDEIDRRWREEGTTIAQQHEVARGLLGQTDAERAVWDATADHGSDVARRSSRLRQLQDRRRAVFGDSFGGEIGHAGEEGFTRLADSIEGFGQEGSARYKNTRGLMMGLVMARIARNRGGKDAQSRAVARSRALVEEARARGVSDEDLATISGRIDTMSESLQGDDGVVALSRGFLDRRGAGFNEIENAETASSRARLMEQALSGVQSFGQGGGALGKLFGGLTADNFTEEELRRRIQRMKPAERQALARERGGRGIAQAIERFGRGDDRGIDDILRQAVDEGQTRTRLRDEYSQHHTRGWLDRDGSSFEADRERWVDSQLRARSTGEASAAAQRRESSDVEAQVRASGLGTASDQLLTAARELNEVVSTFRDVNTARGIQNLVRRDM